MWQVRKASVGRPRRGKPYCSRKQGSKNVSPRHRCRHNYASYRMIFITSLSCAIMSKKRRNRDKKLMTKDRPRFTHLGDNSGARSTTGDIEPRNQALVSWRCGERGLVAAWAITSKLGRARGNFKIIRKQIFYHYCDKAYNLKASFVQVSPWSARRLRGLRSIGPGNGTTRKLVTPREGCNLNVGMQEKLASICNRTTSMQIPSRRCVADRKSNTQIPAFEWTSRFWFHGWADHHGDSARFS